MGKEIIKTPSEKESAEVASFGTVLNSKDMNSGFSSTEILTQTRSKFTDFLKYECVSCRKTIEAEKSVAVDDGWACADCFGNLTAKVAGVLENGGGRRAKTIRLFRCFGCGGNFGSQKMSSFLMICRKCRKRTQTETGDERSRKRFIEKTMLKIGKYFGGLI